MSSIVVGWLIMPVLTSWYC